MKHEIEDQDEAIEIIAAYLERLGIDGLHQPHSPNAINKSAVIRYLIAEKLDEALANPPTASGAIKRAGQGAKKKRQPVSLDTPATKSRQ